MTTILVTGAAGFIGGALSKRLVKDDDKQIIGVDNLNDYYDVELKKCRLREISAAANGNWKMHFGDITDKELVEVLIERYQPEVVINLAGQAGVRYSVENPVASFENNVIGFFNVLESCRKYGVKHFIYASSSAVYGENHAPPFKESDTSDKPESFYAATKKSNELMAESYSKIYGIATTGLRFFTVYGEYGRSDMSYFKFADKMANDETIQLYNGGANHRGFTYISDVVECLMRVIAKPSEGHKVYNVGHEYPQDVLTVVMFLGLALRQAGVVLPDSKLKLEHLPPQKGDVPVTGADMREFEREFGYKPETSLYTGLEKFAKWYAKWRGVKGRCEEHIA